VARYLGLGAVTVQEDRVDWPESAHDKVGNIQLTRILGGGIRTDPAGLDIGIRDSWRRALESIEAAGAKPYAIPAGHPTTRSAAWDSPTGSGRGHLECQPPPTTRTRPATGSTSTTSPSVISRMASAAPTTAGMPSSLDSTAA